MGKNYWNRLFGKRIAIAYLLRFCVRISSISLAKHSTGISGDHGNSFLRLSRTFLGLIEGITDNSQFRYLPYFAWMGNFNIPVTNNCSEWALRTEKTHMKVSGQFASTETA